MHTKVVRVFNVQRRQQPGGNFKTAGIETVVADSMEHAVRMYCTKHGLAGVTKYGNYLWRAYLHGVTYLVRCDSVVAGRERSARA